MNETQKINLIYTILNNYNYDMDKTEIYFNSIGQLTIRDFTYTKFRNGIAVLRSINYYEKFIKLDVIRPDYLVYETLKYNFN